MVSQKLLELNDHIQGGRIEAAFGVATDMPRQDLCNSKVDGRWVLLNLPRKSFPRRGTIRLIKKFVDGGWDVNSRNNVRAFIPSYKDMFGDPEPKNSLQWRGYTLLHVAVSYDCLNLVETLIACGGDVNAVTRGGKGTAVVTPLHTALLTQEWRNVGLLIDHGADLYSVGLVPDSYFRLSSARKDYCEVINGKRFQKCTPLDLILRFGKNLCPNFVDKVIAKIDRPLTTHEYQIAVAGVNFPFINKILEMVQASFNLDEISFLRTWRFNYGQEDRLTPVLSHLLCSNMYEIEDDVGQRVEIMQRILGGGYDVNLAAPKEDPLLFELLTVWYHEPHAAPMVEELLKSPTVAITGKSARQESVLQKVLRMHSNACNCTHTRKHILPKMVGALLNAGANASELVFDEQFRLHEDYKKILQHLYMAGATFTDDFLKATLTCRTNENRLKKERGELNIWLSAAIKKKKENRDISLKNITASKLRSMCHQNPAMLSDIPVFLRRIITCVEIDLA